MNFKSISLFLTTIIIVSCNNENKTDKENLPQVQTSVEMNKDSSAENFNTTLQLLQGKWQSVDDKKSYVIFENNNRIDFKEGDESTTTEPFSLSDKCSNESNKNAEIEVEENKYITCLNSDMCWYILKLDQSELSLSYMSRGNTLTYKRVN